MHEELTERIIGAAMNVHSALGPGLLESTYQTCLEYEFAELKVNYRKQVRLPVTYRDKQLEAGYRIDFFVEESVIVELKAVEKVLPVHLAQLLSYLKLTDCHVGLLLNFNVVHMRSGIRRVVNGA